MFWKPLDENEPSYDYIMAIDFHKSLYFCNQPTDRNFEAFVTVTEISIFGFENSTLPSTMHLVEVLFWLQSP